MATSRLVPSGVPREASSYHDPPRCSDVVEHSASTALATSSFHAGHFATRSRASEQAARNLSRSNLASLVTIDHAV
jgi:hypothetical protein